MLLYLPVSKGHDGLLSSLSIGQHLSLCINFYNVTFFIGDEEGKHSVDTDDNLSNQVYSWSCVYPEFML